MPERYADAIVESSEILAESMLDAPDELFDSGLLLDRLVRDVVREVGRTVLMHVLGALSDQLKSRLVHQGLSVEREPWVPFKTLLGEVEVPSPYLWNEHGESCRPMKSMFGIEGGRCSISVERAQIDFGIEKSFERASSTFFEHYGFEVGRTTVRKRTLRAGEDAQRYLVERFERAIASSNSPETSGAEHTETMLAELDGCEIRTGTLVPTEPAEYDEKGRHKRVRIEKWREVRTGLVRPLDEVFASYICRIGSYDELIAELFAIACERGWSPETQVVAPADGGNGLRDAIEVCFPGVQFILDPYHLKDNFFDAAEALGYKPEQRKAWVRAQLDKIWQGQVDTVLAELHTLHAATDNDRVRQLIGYVDRFSDALDYKKYKEKGWPIGSGQVESAHRFIPQERLKLPGAWWHTDNVNPMLALRVVRANRWWGDFCHWRVQTKTQKLRGGAS